MINSELLFSNIQDKESIINLLRLFIFGENGITKYDPDKVYQEGDKIYIVNPDGTITIVESKENGTTGEFDESKWSDSDITDAIINSVQNLILIQTYQPEVPDTMLWVQPIEYGYHTLPEPIPVYDGNKYSMLFTGEIPIVETVSDELSGQLRIGDIVLDVEGEYSNNVDQDLIDEFHNQGEFIVDEQKDVEVSTTQPATTDPSFIWFDTDVTDDDV